MLCAVNIGRSKPCRLCLSSRRSIRRLRWASCRRILVFTRNPFLAGAPESVVTLQTLRKDQGFRVFLEILPLTRPGGSLVQGLADLCPGLSPAVVTLEQWR